MATVSFDIPVLSPPLKDGAWKLAADWELEYDGETYRLPAGFETDGASIPRFLWRVCGTPLQTPRLYAALVHDYLYGGGDKYATRADADALFRDIQIALGVSRVKAYIEYYALRLCGASHWKGGEE